MPIYEYKCKKCGHRYEQLQDMNAGAPDCPKCKGASEKQLSASTPLSSRRGSSGGACLSGGCGASPAAFGSCKGGKCCGN